MFCPQCGTKANHGAQFCSHCGASLPLTTAAAPANGRPPVPSGGSPSAPSSGSSPTPPSKSPSVPQAGNTLPGPYGNNPNGMYGVNNGTHGSGSMYSNGGNGYGPTYPNGTYVYSKYPAGWVSSPGIVENFKWCFLDNYVNFEGRATRQEYWYFQLATLVITLVSAILTLGIGLYIAPVVFLLPNLAVTARRLHDTGRSTLWLLLGLTGLGSFVLLVFMCLESDPQPNEFGPLPDFRNYIPHGQRHKQNF